MTLSLFTLLTSASYAQSYSTSCQVNLVDPYSDYVYDTFTSYSDSRGQCQAGLRACNRARLERGARHLKCVTLRNDHRTPPGTPVYPYNRFSHLLRYSDHYLANYALDGRVGSCRVEFVRSSYGRRTCEYYVFVDGRPYPNPTRSSCTQREFTRAYGCNSASEQENAGCMIRKAITSNLCR